ncbi:efflux RND transporter periplasmic adaptor subunit [Flavipsychrobacter stenotrophus]|nr:efflux RND transporter periplasmic adaptor subunit [Flavipsychrobacter stenotrophus]
MIKEIKKMNRSVLHTTIFIAGMAALAACGEKKADVPNPANIPVPVNIYEVHAEKAVYYDMYPGTVVALNQVDLRSQTEGYVTGIFFKDGDHVTKGQKLYQIDVSKYQATVSQSNSALMVAKSNLDQAQKDADRYTYLNEHDAVAKQTLDHAMTALQNAKNQYAAAKQDVVKTQTDLNYSIIKAPFDGTIGISQVRQGASVSAGSTILNTISTNDPMAVDILINEKQIPHFVSMQKQTVNNADSLFTLLMPDNSLYGGTGQISLIDRGVNAQTGSITVRIAFPNKGGLLRAGMSSKVRVRNQDTAMQVIIPNKAVVEQMGEYFVYVAKDTVIRSATDTTVKKAEAPSPHAVQRKVTLGVAIADRIIVKSGLNEGDRVIVDGVQKLHDGSLIKQP